MQIVIDVDDASGTLKDVGTSVPIDARLLAWYLDRAKDKIVAFTTTPKPLVAPVSGAALSRLPGGKPPANGSA